MQTLTNGQKQALLESQNGHNIFISGGGGVGKSYISQIIVDELQAAGKNCINYSFNRKSCHAHQRCYMPPCLSHPNPYDLVCNSQDYAKRSYL